MILGELISIISLPVSLILLAIGIIGLWYESMQELDRPYIDLIYCIFISVGLVAGIGLLVWFFIYSGIGNEIGSFLYNLWNMDI